MKYLSLFAVALCLLAGCADAPNPTESAAPKPVPVAPAPAPTPPKPVPANKVKLLLFTQPGCPPCAHLKRMLADPAIADTAIHFDVEEVTPPDKRFRQYKVNGTPALFALTASGPHRFPNGGSLGQLAAWLGRWEPKTQRVETLSEGGPVGPGGVQVACDLPPELRMKNVGGVDGAGLCVFTSIMHAARWANELPLWELQKVMRKERGGGWPQKVDAMLKKYAPGVKYLQYEGKDPAVLELALRTGRMPAITYEGRDMHYGRGQKIAHMVSLVYLSKTQNLACILDNNFIQENQLVWMSYDEFLSRWTGGRSGWCVVLLHSRPPAPPKNK